MKKMMLFVVLALTLACGSPMAPDFPELPDLNPENYVFVETDLAFRAYEGCGVPTSALGVIWRACDGSDFDRYCLYVSETYTPQPLESAPRQQVFEAEQDRLVLGGLRRGVTYYLLLVVYTDSGVALCQSDTYTF